jgi:hypothetical protein
MDGWPVALPGCVVTIRETGVALGSLLLEDKEWHAMRAAPVHALVGDRSLSDWVLNNHGSSGRLLLWDDDRRWWMAQAPELELVVAWPPPRDVRLGFSSAVVAVVRQRDGTAGGRRTLRPLRGDLARVNRLQISDPVRPGSYCEISGEPDPL